MKLKEGFILRSICGEHVVVGEGLAQVNFNKMLSLNESAAYLWEAVAGREFTKEEMVQLLLDKYEVTPERAAEDVDNLLKVWIEQGVAEA
ncbi:MAG: PqqD family protein [Bacteroidales bacterium]|nr:PqqD family protein [Bacteroidales bacterium]